MEELKENATPTEQKQEPVKAPKEKKPMTRMKRIGIWMEIL